MKQGFTLINDFAANGYGICNLEKKDHIKLDQLHPDESAPKVVMGPGTGLGFCYLTKPKDGKYYDVHSAEAGHTDFSVVSEEDWLLHQHVIKYVKESQNIENKRGGHASIDRVSVERLCAGPAVPLLYDFFRNQERFKNVERFLEKDKTFEELTSKDIIDRGMAYEENGDELCREVIRKFTEIYATEIGNAALYYLPFGGIYLVGGVTAGLMQHLELPEKNEEFMQRIYSKGRLEACVRRVPIFLVNPQVELGLLGAEECAYRQLEKSL